MAKEALQIRDKVFDILSNDDEIKDAGYKVLRSWRFEIGLDVPYIHFMTKDEIVEIEQDWTVDWGTAGIGIELLVQIVNKANTSKSSTVEQIGEAGLLKIEAFSDMVRAKIKPDLMWDTDLSSAVCRYHGTKVAFEGTKETPLETRVHKYVVLLPAGPPAPKEELLCVDLFVRDKGGEYKQLVKGIKDDN